MKMTSDIGDRLITVRSCALSIMTGILDDLLLRFIAVLLRLVTMALPVAKDISDQGDVDMESAAPLIVGTVVICLRRLNIS